LKSVVEAAAAGAVEEELLKCPEVITRLHTMRGRG